MTEARTRSHALHHHESAKCDMPRLRASFGSDHLLQVLEQETAFNSLQWFKAVQAAYRAEAEGVAARPPPPPPPSPGSLLDSLGSTLRGAHAIRARDHVSLPTLSCQLRCRDLCH